MAVLLTQLDGFITGTGALSSTPAAPAGTRGVLIYVIQFGGTTHEVTGATFGGVSLTELSFSPVVHSSGETGVVYAYFLGSGVPSGNQTWAVSVDGTGSTKAAAFFAYRASTDTEVVDDFEVNLDSSENPLSTLFLSGRTASFSIAFLSGKDLASGVTPLAGWVSGAEFVSGAKTAGAYFISASGSADQTAGWTQTADDAVCIALAIGEVLITGTMSATGLVGTAAMTGTVMAPASSPPSTPPPVTTHGGRPARHQYDHLSNDYVEPRPGWDETPDKPEPNDATAPVAEAPMPSPVVLTESDRALASAGSALAEIPTLEPLAVAPGSHEELNRIALAQLRAEEAALLIDDEEALALVMQLLGVRLN